MSIKKNDFVSWRSSGGIAKGKIKEIIKDGEVEGIDGDVKITGSEESPAALIEVYKNKDGEWQASGTMVGHKLDSLRKIEELNSEINEFDLEDIDSEINAENEDTTNFPNKGDNEKISLRNSKYPVKLYSYIKNIKENYPSIWRLGGNEQTTTWNGNKAFSAYERIKSGESEEESWVKARERFFDRFYNNIKNKDGIIAAMKWIGAVAIGEAKMKSIINEEKKKVDDSKNNSETNTLYTSLDGIIEICEMPEDKMAGRVKIRMSAHKIVEKQSLETANENGICWLENFVKDNIDTCIGMPYVVDWMYSKEEGIPSGHGKMSHTDDGEVIFEGESVGTVLEAKIEDIEIDGIIKKVLMTEGYIYEQRNKPLVEFLRSQKKEGNKVYGSIEINGKNGSKTIEYLDGNKNPDGTLKMDRVPTVYSYSGLAILYIDPPADKSSVVFEINSKQNNLNIENKINNKGGEIANMNKIASGKIVEINSLDSYQIEKMLLKAFKITIGDISECYDCGYGYYVTKLYPLNSEFIVEKWMRGCEDKYYKATYSIDSNNTVTLGDVYEVEKGWIPVNNEKPIEINSEGGKIEMEYQAKYEALSKDFETMKVNFETMMKDKEIMVKEMEEKNAKVVGMEATVTEVNEALVNANKLMEETNAKMKTMEEEMNSYKGKYETMMAEKNAADAEAEKSAKIVEVNSYFEKEITKNGFDEAEINSLKSFVDAVDLEGLKQAETELCVKKFKELALKNSDTEVNTKSQMFISIKEKEKKEIKGTIPTFFN